MNKIEFAKLNKDQMIIAFNQLKDDYSKLFNELEEKEEQMNVMSEAFDELAHQKQDYTQINILEMKLEEKNKEIEELIKYINSKHYEYGDIESQDCEDYDIGFDEIEEILKKIEQIKNNITIKVQRGTMNAIRATNGFPPISDYIEYQKPKEEDLQSQAINEAIKYIKDNLIVASILNGKKTYCLNPYSFDYEELLEILERGKNGKS